MSDDQTNPNEHENEAAEGQESPVEEAAERVSEAVTSATTPPDAPEIGETTPDERTMAMLAHLLGIVTWFVGPLIVWLVKKDQSKFVDDQGKEAVNFQITIGIAYIITCIPACLLSFVILCFAYFLPLIVWVLMIIFAILAGLAANKGEAYRYPLCLRLIK